MKRLLILLIFSILIVGCQDKNVGMSEKIIKAIDDNCKQSSSCNISIKELSSFKWDKMVIFEVGSSNAEVSKALGVKYEDSTDLMGGMVFIYDNKIVYNEKLPYNPELPSKLWFTIDNDPGEPNCWIFTQNDAVFIASRIKTDGVYYYEIKPVKTNQ